MCRSTPCIVSDITIQLIFLSCELYNFSAHFLICFQLRRFLHLLIQNALNMKAISVLKSWILWFLVKLGLQWYMVCDIFLLFQTFRIQFWEFLYQRLTLCSPWLQDLQVTLTQHFTRMFILELNLQQQHQTCSVGIEFCFVCFVPCWIWEVIILE